ncbi:MAG TPA: hypothetical protein VF552_13550 [Allosphingosinicella sp.]|jgi:hypothetical protein
MSGFDERAERGAIGPAAAAAVAVPVLPLALLAIPAPGLAAFILVFGLVVAALHVLILFLPAWILLSRRTPLEWPATAALGLVCGALPWVIFWPRAAWIFGLCGFVGGTAFHLVVRRSRNALE